MWILSWLPYWIFYALFFIGVAAYAATYLLKFIPLPFLYTYKLPIQLVSLVLIVVGVYMSGAISNEETWQLKVKELEVKVAEAQAKSSEENVKIVEKVVTKTNTIVQKDIEIKEIIVETLVAFDDKFAPDQECSIPVEFYKVLNAAAKGPNE